MTESTTVKYMGRTWVVTTYTDPHPNMKGTDYVDTGECGKCGGTGVYHGHSGWKFGIQTRRGVAVNTWCFDCNGSGRAITRVSNARRSAKIEAVWREHGDTIRAEQRAAAEAAEAERQRTEAAKAAETPMTTKFPTAPTVSRALRRDAGVITSPHGYEVRRGLEGVTGPSISVVISDAEPTNVRAAADLTRHLREQNWDVELAEGSSIIYVNRVPSAREARAVARLVEGAQREAERIASLNQNTVGEIGERVRNIEATVEVATTFDRRSFTGYGTDTVHLVIFKLDDGRVIKATGTGLNLYGLDRGDRVKVAGTVKGYSEYRGQRQTELARVKVDAIKEDA